MRAGSGGGCAPQARPAQGGWQHRDKFITNGDNLDKAIGTSRHGKGKLPDPKEDIELLVDLLNSRFGETWEALQEPCELSKLKHEAVRCP